jgi:hypothetical protein
MSEPVEDASPSDDAWPTRVFVGSTAAWGCLHVASIFTENINWDEFALLARVERMLATGAMQGAGRPGAIEIVLAPLVRGCGDAVIALREARLLSAFATFLAIFGLYVLACRVCSDRERPTRGAWLAVALLIFAMPFQRWSVQVRTDPFGVAWGIWGAVVWLGAMRRHRNAVIAGSLFGLGFLFTQKVLYVALLGGCLRAGAESREQQPKLRQLWMELALCGGALLSIIFVYRLIIPLFLEPPAQLGVGRALEIFDNYRKTFGFALYWGLLPALVPHLVLIALLVAATAVVLRAGKPRGRLVLSWSLLGLAVAVACFHTATFPYFWMTLGLFPALALANAADEIACVLPARVRRFAIAVWTASLLVPTAVYALTLLDDTQRVQRDALGFVAREFGPDRNGFQLEGALACRHDPDPFQVYFRHHIERGFSGPNAKEIPAFLQRFQNKPVHFLIQSHMLGFFPQPIRQFWAENYQPYFGPVFVVGRLVQNADPSRWDVFAPGEYRWQSLDARGSSQLQVDGRTLRARETIELTRGAHSLAAIGGPGRLVFSVDAEPNWSAAPFYAPAAIREIIGGSYWGR